MLQSNLETIYALSLI